MPKHRQMTFITVKVFATKEAVPYKLPLFNAHATAT